MNFIDKNGNYVEGTEPNAYKFEMFIFDSYEMFDDVVVLRVKREEEFAPIKNAQGVDSPETARKLYMHRNTLTYRLDKIERATGLDIRNFSDAITFRLCGLLYKISNK